MRSGKPNIIKQGQAMRVIFFYPGEEGTCVENAEVTLFENGIVHIQSTMEETTTHLQNCEILWRFRTDVDDRAGKVRLLKGKAKDRGFEAAPVTPGKNGVPDSSLRPAESSADLSADRPTDLQ